jgi:hypothetical protein
MPNPTTFFKSTLPVKETGTAVVKPAVAQSVNGRAVVPVRLCKICGTQNPDKDTSKPCCKDHVVSVDATTIRFNDKGEIVGAVYL